MTQNLKNPFLFYPHLTNEMLHLVVLASSVLDDWQEGMRLLAESVCCIKLSMY